MFLASVRVIYFDEVNILRCIALQKFFRSAFLINWINFALTRRQPILETGSVTMSTADSLCVVCSGAEEGRLFVSGHLLQLLRPPQEY